MKGYEDLFPLRHDDDVEFCLHLPGAMPAMQNPYDEDGYCCWCGNGNWKGHASWCNWQDEQDKRETLRP